MTVYGTTSTVTDGDYDALAGPVRWETQYWWPERCWRRVKTQRLEWGRGVAPADPDAQMEPEWLPGDSWRNASAGKAAITARQRSERAVLGCLREHGPQTVLQIAARTGLNRDTVTESLKRRADLFGHNGKTKNRVWHAPAQRPDGSPNQEGKS